jgi:hypothetical protein
VATDGANAVRFYKARSRTIAPIWKWRDPVSGEFALIQLENAVARNPR